MSDGVPRSSRHSDDTDPWRGGDVRTREANAGVLFPVRRVRWSQSLLAALHSSVDEFSCGDRAHSGNDVRT